MARKKITEETQKTEADIQPVTVEANEAEKHDDIQPVTVEETKPKKVKGIKVCVA